MEFTNRDLTLCNTSLSTSKLKKNLLLSLVFTLLNCSQFGLDFQISEKFRQDQCRQPKYENLAVTFHF